MNGPPLAAFQNGSLFPAINLTFGGLYPRNEFEQNVDLTIEANNITSITFLAQDPWISSTFPLAAALFDSSLVRFPVRCIYPVSGQYDTLGRYFFYSALIFSFVVRRHSGLAIASLGIAMLYAATAALHAIVLFIMYKWTAPEHANLYPAEAFKDIDIVPISAILGMSAVMLAPILNWSLSVRRHRARIIIVFWGLLILSALYPVFLYSDAPGIILFRHWALEGPLSFALCRQKEARSDPRLHLRSEMYRECNCIDFCGTFSTQAPMRSGQQMLPWLDQELSKGAYMLETVEGWMSAAVIRYGPGDFQQSIFPHGIPKSYIPKSSPRRTNYQRSLRWHYKAAIYPY